MKTQEHKLTKTVAPYNSDCDYAMKCICGWRGAGNNRAQCLALHDEMIQS